MCSILHKSSIYCDLHGLMLETPLTLGYLNAQVARTGQHVTLVTGCDVHLALLACQVTRNTPQYRPATFFGRANSSFHLTYETFTIYLSTLMRDMSGAEADSALGLISALITTIKITQKGSDTARDI
jgi:hypothetical protein